MGVYIKGTKMPTDREWVDVRIFRDGTAIVTGERAHREEHKVIYLPPHGRLVDADALYIEILNRGIDGLQMDDFSEIQQVIEDAQTVIEAEEVIE